MATVFTNATIVTVDPGNTVHYNAALVVKDDSIEAVGPTNDISLTYPNADVIDCEGKVLFPGLINCHAHLTATLNRGITEDFGFPPDLGLPIQAQSVLNDEELTIMALLGALEAIKSGTSTSVQNGAGIGTFAKELSKTGLRWIFAESGRDAITPSGWRPGEDVYEFSEALRQDALQTIEDLFSAWHGAENGLITCFPSAALTETSSPELLQAIREIAEKHDVGYTIHLAQSRLEVESMMRLRGIRPTFYLYKNEFLSERLFAAHCRYVDSSEIALLGHSKSIITHQPAMAANRGVIPPIPALRAAGSPIAMGTDNNTQDMVEVMRMGLVTERILRDDGKNPQPEEILRETTMGGAHAVRKTNQIGSLETGKKADILVVNARKAHLVPTTRIVSSFIHNGQPQDIESLMVTGEFVMRAHKVLTIDEDQIVKQADVIGRRAWNEVIRKYPNAPFPTSIAPSEEESSDGY